jgi:integrase
MIRTAKLYARVNDNGTFRWTPVKFGNNGTAKEPTSFTRKGGDIIRITPSQIVSYGIRVKNTIKSVAEDLPTAEAKWRETQQRIGKGLTAVPSSVAVLSPLGTQQEERTTIAGAVERFIKKLSEDVAANKRAKGTMYAYQKAASDFRDTCGVTYIDEITGPVLLDHLTWLRQNLKRRYEDQDGRRVLKGHAENTLVTRFEHLEVFGTFVGIKLAKDKRARPGDTGLIANDDVPRRVNTSEEKKMKGTLIFSDDELQAMLDVATVDEADLIHFALKTGFRVKAIAAAEWSDIDWDGKTRPQGNGERIPNIMTGPKQISEWLPEGFRPKTARKSKKFHQIEIPSLVQRLKARRERMEAAGVKSTLIFPNGGGRIHTGNGLLDKIKEVVKRARKDKNAKIGGAIGAHRFRKTFGTYVLRASDIATASMLLDHANIQTTMVYLGVDRSGAAKALQTAFQKFD